MTEQVINVGSTKQLFLDDHVVGRTENVTRQLHRPVRHDGNPVLKADRPWEKAKGVVNLSGGTVLFDEEAGHFKMWYRTSDMPMMSMEHWRGSQDDLVPEGAYKVGYAVSDDGVHWEKPVLGLVESGGSKENNLIPPGTGGRGHIRRPNIIKDYEDPDPSKRYKMLYLDEMTGEYMMSAGYSGDGIHWRMGVIDPISFEPPVLPHGTIFGWDPRAERYVYFHRKGGYDPKYFAPADVDGRRVRTDHGAFVQSTSADFEHWGDTREVVRHDPAIDPPNWEPGAHLGVLAAVLYTDDLYVGVMDVSTTHYVEDAPPELWETVYMWEHPEHKTELVISRDGVSWRRVSPHWEFLRPGMFGSWDTQAVAVSKPIVRNDEILVYYTATGLPDKATLPNHPQNHLLAKLEDGEHTYYAVGLARMRLDGFASMDAYDSPGTLTTRPLVFQGDRLEVNVRAPEAPFGAEASPGAPFGTMTVEALDRGGAPVPGYSRKDCDAFSGDDVRHTVTWNGRSDIGHLTREPVRLRFHLHHAAVYSLRFRGEREPDSVVNLLEPGSRGRP